MKGHSEHRLAILFERTPGRAFVYTTHTAINDIYIGRAQYNLLNTPVLIQDAPLDVTFLLRPTLGDIASRFHTDAPQTYLFEATRSCTNYKTRPRLNSLFSFK